MSYNCINLIIIVIIVVPFPYEYLSELKEYYITQSKTVVFVPTLSEPIKPWHCSAID